MSTVSSAPSPLERKVILLVALVQFVNILDFVMVMPLGQMFADALHIPEARLGLVGGSYTAAAAISGLLASRFLDRFDRRPALTVAMLGLVLSTAAGGLARDLPTMMAARMLAGVFGGPATSLALSIIADVVPSERRGRAMGVVMASFSVASVIGIPAGIYAAEAGSWRTPFFGLAGLGLAVTVYAAGALPSLRIHLGERRARTGMFALLRRPSIALALASIAVSTISIFMVVPYIRTFLENNYHYPRDAVKYLYLAGGVASFITARLSGGFVDRVGSTPVATAGTVLIISCLTLGFLPAQPIVPIAVVFTAFMCTASLRGVPISTLTSRLPAAHERAQYMSLQSVVQHVASSAGAIASSQILATGPRGELIHMEVVVFLAVGFATMLPFLLWRIERYVRPVAA